jgi:iron complex outermembrane receptor protein
MWRRPVACGVFLAVGTTSLAGTSHAAEADSLLLEEVTVTAQKREQNVQDIGISITALSGDQLDQLGYVSTADIIAQTPSMKMLSFSPSLTIFNIRGVSQNDFADHYEPPVAVFVDESYVSAQGAVNTQMFDVERVEVLRGPQGTLFGRNATGGAIQYVSRTPTAQLDGYSQITLGSFNQRNLEGAIGGPLSETTSARVAVAYAANDGWIDNRIGADLNKSDDLSARVFFKYEPSDAATLLLKLHGSRNDDTSGGYSHRALFANADGLGQEVPENVNFYGTCGGCDLTGYRNPSDDPWHQAHDRIGFLERDIAGASAKLTVDLDIGTLTSITDYLYLDKRFGSDSDASPSDLLTFDTDQRLDQYSQEVRLSGDAQGLRWVGGVYLLYIDTTGRQQAGIGTALYDPPYAGTNDYHLTSRSAAAFGQLEYDVSERLTTIVGARYTYDVRKMDMVVTDTAGALVAFNTALYPDIAEQSFSNVSAKLELDWRASDAVMVYGSVNRGTKAGNFSAPVFLPFAIADLPHDEEVLTAYELGVKSTVFDGRARLNASAFHYDYDDYQAFFLSNLSQRIANRDATIDGLELELTVNPVSGLDLSLGASYLDGKVKDITLPSGRITDREMPMSPEWGLNGLIRYRWDAFGGTLAVQTDAMYSSTFNFYVLNPPSTQEPAYTVVNARVAFTSGDGRWELAGAVKNLFDEEYRQYSNDISSLSIGLDAYAPPRWASVSFTYNW